MTPQEIRQLRASSPPLRKAMETDKQRIWQFLRQQVSIQCVLACGRCEKITQLLRSPYALDLCIECLLCELLEGGPLLADEYRDPRSRKYDAKYDASCKYWEEFYNPTLPDDYDGPPIAIG